MSAKVGGAAVRRSSGSGCAPCARRAVPGVIRRRGRVAPGATLAPSGGVAADPFEGATRPGAARCSATSGWCEWRGANRRCRVGQRGAGLGDEVRGTLRGRFRVWQAEASEDVLMACVSTRSVARAWASPARRISTHGFLEEEFHLVLSYRARPKVPWRASPDIRTLRVSNAQSIRSVRLTGSRSHGEEPR